MWFSWVFYIWWFYNCFSCIFPFSSLSRIAVCFLRTRTNVVPITFSINISQNLFSDPNIISHPCLPNQIQGFFWGPVQTPALHEVFLACAPLTILPSFQSLLLSEPVPHTLIPCWQLGLSLQPHFMLESFHVCRRKKKVASQCSRVIADMSFCLHC